MAFVYQPMETSLIPNTVMWEGYNNGVHKNYRIQAVEGYVLHDKARDVEDDYGNIIRGYTRSIASCGAAYDFTLNEREFYAVPESEVPEDQIYGTEPDHEIM